MSDKQNNSASVVPDQDLNEVTGGYITCEDSSTGKYYKYTGNDKDKKYACPNCGRPVHSGAGWRFYCNPCNESWFCEGLLRPNLNSGVWKEISEQEYYGGVSFPGY